MAQQQASAGQLLSDAQCHAVLSTTDMERSRRFWEKTCGLRVTGTDGQGIKYDAGHGTTLYVYHRPDAPKAENTAVGFNVQDVARTVEALRRNGVRFEEYDMPGLKTRNGIATSPDGKWQSAWFKDPDGNICAVGKYSG